MSYKENMLSKERHALATVVIVWGLLLTGCGQTKEVKTMEATTLPKSVEVAREVGVQVEVPIGEEEGLGVGCTYNAYRMGWVMDYSDAGNILNVVFHPDSTFQYICWDDENYRDLVDQAMMEFDFDTRMALWQEAESVLMTDHAAVIPIFHYDRSTLVKADIEVVFPPFGAPPFKHWRLSNCAKVPRGRTASLWSLSTMWTGLSGS